MKLLPSCLLGLRLLLLRFVPSSTPLRCREGYVLHVIKAGSPEHYYAVLHRRRLQKNAPNSSLWGLHLQTSDSIPPHTHTDKPSFNHWLSRSHKQAAPAEAETYHATPPEAEAEAQIRLFTAASSIALLLAAWSSEASDASDVDRLSVFL